MQFWQSLAMTDINDLPTLAEKAEQLNFTGVTFSDHLMTFERSNEEGITWSPETHWPDPWVIISALSQITRKLKFMTTVYVLPMRDPISSAKTISTAAIMSNNRLELGIGVGEHAAEFEAVGQNYRNRGKRTDEMLSILNQLMSGNSLAHHGEFYRFEALRISPGIAKKIPIYIAGISSAALKRAAKHEGWISYQHDVEEIGALINALKEERALVGKALDEDFKIVTSLRNPSPGSYALAKELGVTDILRPPWLDEHGGPSILTLEEKIEDMKIFSEKYIHS